MFLFLISVAALTILSEAALHFLPSLHAKCGLNSKLGHDRCLPYFFEVIIPNHPPIDAVTF